MASDGRAEFDPSEIARVDFPTAFRGYDQDAVRRYLSRLAAAVGRAQELGLLGTVDPEQDDEHLIELELEASSLRQRVEELEGRLVEAQAQVDAGAAAPPASEHPLDEAELIKLLGTETARILETARSAGADITKRAENEAAALRQQSESECRALKNEAESTLVSARAEADSIVTAAEAEAAREQTRSKAEAARILEEARIDGERVRDEAAAAAESEMGTARQRASQVIGDAEGLREEILGDLATRRRISREQLVVMNAARDRLAVALAAARSELDDVTSVLQRAAPAQDEIDVREPSPETLNAAKGADSHRAEVADLVALLDRSRPENGSNRSSGDGGSGHGSGTLVGAGAPASGGPLPSSTAPANGSGSSNGSVASGGTSPTGLNGSANGVNGSMSATGSAGANGAGSNGSNGGATGSNGTASGSNDTASGSNDTASGSNGASGAAAGSAGANGSPRSGSPLSGAAGSGPGITSPGSPGGSFPSGSISNGSISNGLMSNGLIANGLIANGTANPTALNGAAVNGGGPNGSRPGAGLPMEYLTVDGPGSSVALDDGPATPMKLDDLLILADSDLGTADRPRSDEIEDLRIIGFGGMRGGPSPLVGSGSGSLHRSAARGDLPRTTPFAGVLPTAFEGRDIALNRATPGFRRRLKRAVNDDQSEVLEALRAGRGTVTPSELPPLEHQLDVYIDALRPVLFDVVTSGAELLGCLDIPVPAVESLCLQLSRHVVECLRTPAIAAIERAATTDREAILDPIRGLYRDFRNGMLPDLIEDALHEAFALGLYHAIDPSDQVLWITDPRLDPDPICEDNSASRALPKGANFPSGHPRPLSMPGCRCLAIPAG